MHSLMTDKNRELRISMKINIQNLEPKIWNFDFCILGPQFYPIFTRSKNDFIIQKLMEVL